MIGLGRMLAEAREVRGTTLDEAERDTRIARRYLLALEEEDFNAFPARVQARGFLRMYAQYLELDSGEMLALFPHDSLIEEADSILRTEQIFKPRRPRPSFHLPAISFSNPGVLLAAIFAGVVLGTGLVGARCATRTERANAEIVLLSDGVEGDGLRVPDVRDADLTSALTIMEEAGIRPLVIEVRSDAVAAGLVISQSPPPGATVLRGTDTTLIVSRGRQ